MWPYIQIARVDHWFKNSFMLLGVMLALFYEPALCTWASLPRLALALLATCLIASSNYVLNELLDASRDRFHPVKKHRPVPSGKVHPALALLEWALLGALGLGTAIFVNPYFAASGLALWAMGLVYNVPLSAPRNCPMSTSSPSRSTTPCGSFWGGLRLSPRFSRRSL